uniref:(California timema) hypothetical protein n=1 Tax=Timema californicum TaxID=61474 RepID=A0A7R9P404_TIMCA|nr:unnamed protein product [Timema californicum]
MTYGMDLNGARRKNATRETTSTLKAWLNEHKKNPYPTKGEKIMLAIITKMTLTQVSTWFANARRRLKKENKMTWEPRNRVEDEDNNNDDEGGRKSADNVKDPDSKDSGTASSEDGDRPPPPLDAASDCWSESRPDSGPDSPECLYERPHHLLHPAYHHLHHPSRLTAPSSASSPPPAGSSGGGNPKPRIWSLADMASKENDVHYQPVTTSAFYSAGKLVSPLASRGAALHPHHLHHSVHHPGAYARHDLYRFYGSAAAGHLAAAGGSGVGDVSLLETYSRTFGAGAFGVANSGVGGAGISPLSSVLSKAAAVAAAAAGGSPFPMNGGGAGSLGLTVSTSAGASSSSSTGSSVAEHLQSAGLHASVDSKLPPPSDGGKQLQLNKA